MGLRDKLEQVKAEKEGQKKEAEAVQQAEQVAAEKTAEADFQKTFQEWKNIAGTVENFQGAGKAVKSAKEKRQGKAGNIKKVLEEIKKEDESDETTFREALKGASEEDKQGEGETEEAQYYEASKEVKITRQEAKAAREALQNLGIDAEGKTDEELAREVKKVGSEKREALETYVREHPDSELPEAKEMRQEMINKREKELVETISESERILFGGAINAALSDLERNSRKDWLESIDGEDPRRRESLAEHLPRAVIKKLEGSPEYERALDALSKDLQAQKRQFDSIDAKALEGAIKKLLLNFRESPYRRDGEFGPIDSNRAHTTWENSIKNEKILRRIYESFPGQSLKEFQYEDSRELKYEAYPMLATLFDGADLQKLAQQSLERASIKGKLDVWDTEKAKRSRSLEESEREYQTQEREASQAEHRLRNTQEGLRSLEESENGLQIALQELTLEKPSFKEDERVSLSSSYNQSSISFEADEEEYNEVDEEQKKLVLEAEFAVTVAEKALREMPKKGVFEGQKSYDAKREVLVDSLAATRKAVEEAKAKRSEALTKKHNQGRGFQVKKVEDIAGKVNLEKYSGTWAGLISKIEGAITEKSTSLRQEKERLEKAREESEGLLKAEKEKLENIADQVAEKKVELERFDEKNKNALQRDFENIKQGW